MGNLYTHRSYVIVFKTQSNGSKEAPHISLLFSALSTLTSNCKHYIVGVSSKKNITVALGPRSWQRLNHGCRRFRMPEAHDFKIKPPIVIGSDFPLRCRQAFGRRP